jgi:carbamoyltransferase
MNILSIQTGHNATVGLMQHGEIIALLSQEKIDNVKNSATFPRDAIVSILRECGLEARDIDEVAIAGLMIFPAHCTEESAQERIIDHNNPPITVKLAKRLEKTLVGIFLPKIFNYWRIRRHEKLRTEGLKHLSNRLNELGLADKPLHFIDHHTCHARSSYYALEQEIGSNSLVFTLDGMGDGLCATVTRVGPNGEWQRIAVTPLNASLGMIYSETTRFLGMKIMEHEYKVMGLSAYCKGYHLETYKRIFEPIIDIDPNNPLAFKAAFHTSDFYAYLVKYAVGERFDNIAGAVQHLVEERVTQWIKNAIQATGIRRIFTGGGVFMNVKLNMRIQEIKEVEQAWFLPSCGDESNPIGALYDRAIQLRLPVKPLKNLYLGISYNRDQIASFITENNLEDRYEICEPEDIERSIAELLANGNVVARFSGRCEWGARSLGNRAILAHPTHLESFYTVNDLIKARDFWMPFAPTVLDTWAHRYLMNYEPDRFKAPHMITAFRATALGVKHLRAAMHQGDFTIRPQVLEQKVNPGYYHLLEEFEKITGVGGLMNTSFNLHGFPLVATLQQAFMTIENSGLNYMALDQHLLKKKVLK